MNLLIIYTHPNHKSLCYSFLENVLKGAEENSNISHVQVLDLYEEQFDPILRFNEKKRRRDMHRDPNLETYRLQLLWADKIIFIYPIWWGRPPAMLLGFIDQMFASNFAYKDIGKILPEGLLKGKSVICISTMKGPKHYPLFLLNNAHKVLMKKALFNYVGIKKVKFIEFGNMEGANKGQNKKLQLVYQHVKKLVI